MSLLLPGHWRCSKPSSARARARHVRPRAGWAGGAVGDLRCARSREQPRARRHEKLVTTMGSIRPPVAWREWNRPRSGGSPDHHAGRAVSISSGKRGHQRDFVLLSTIAALLVADLAEGGSIVAATFLAGTRSRRWSSSSGHRRGEVEPLASWRARHGVPGLRRVVVDDRAPRAGTWQRRDGH